jgi:DNA polymerase I-like protein with 3'-5' exonuclease and polymerase domains
VQFRLLANFAVGHGAEEARQQYRDEPDTDFHKMTADMLGADRNDKIKRKRVKNTNFAKVFGAQVPKLAATFGCSIQEAQEFMIEYERKLPFVKETFDAAARWAQKRGFVVSIMNRKQRFPFWGPQRYMRHGPSVPLFRERSAAVDYWLRGEARTYRGWAVRAVERVNTYMACNRKMQSSEGDIMKKWMVMAQEAGLLAPGALGPLKATVHDELGSSVPRTKLGDEAGKELVRIGENVVQMKVPLRVNSSRGKSWGDC